MAFVDEFERREDQGPHLQELNTSRSSEEARAEIQSAIIIAKKCPRNENQARQDLLNACKRPGFAEKAVYSFPRWNSETRENVEITGPSVNMAREAARVWGNMRWGFVVVSDADNLRTIEGFGFDMQSNTRVSEQSTFKKEGWLKGKVWGALNERAIRELTSRMAAFAIRNSLLQLIPKDIVDDAMAIVDKTLDDETSKDPAAEQKKIIDKFGNLNVKVAALEKYLECAIADISPNQLANLRKIYKSIEDGNSSWSDYVKEKEGDPPSETEAKSRSKRPAPAATTNADNGQVPASTAATAGPGGEPPINDNEKGLVYMIAKNKGWAGSVRTKDDPLHAYLKTCGIESVRDIPGSKLKPILADLEKGPVAFNMKPVEPSTK